MNAAGPGAAAALKQAGAVLVTAFPQWPLPRQRDAGVRAAKGDIVAVLHERYTVSRDWVSAVLQAHSGEFDVVCGVVYPSEDLSMTAWAMFLSEYSHMCPHLASGIPDAANVLLLPTGNASYKRHAFELGNLSAARDDSDFHADLLGAGARFIREARMQAMFATAYSIAEYVGERFTISRNYAAHRARQMSVARRCGAAALRFGLPGLVLARVAARVFAGGRFRARFVATLPWILAFGMVQMIGEIFGYLAPAKAED